MNTSVEVFVPPGPAGGNGERTLFASRPAIDPKVSVPSLPMRDHEGVEYVLLVFPDECLKKFPPADRLLTFAIL